MIKKFTTIALLSGSVLGVTAQNVNVTGGNDHALALCREGKIYAWGLNLNNRLCLPAPFDTATVVPTPTLVNTGDLTFTQISAGSGSHSIALATTGVPYCWGDNSYLQCAKLDPNDSLKVVNVTPIPVPCGEAPGYDLNGEPGGNYLGNVKAVAATAAASIALLNDGTCVIWGGNHIAVPGGFLKDIAPKPIYVRDKDGEILKNIIYVTGGDNTILLIVGNTSKDKTGTLYSMGTWDGRGNEGNKGSTYAAPVEIGDGTGAKSSGKQLTNVKIAGMSDTGGFAVDGTNGYVYGWGNNGWWGICGLQLAYKGTILYPEKVTSGAYGEISGNEFLTNATQIVGGNGYAAALTRDGNVLYWGDNNAARNGGATGGVIPNKSYALNSNTNQIGPVFANYCAGEHGSLKEHRVDDAVAIGRGDLVGFVLNKEGDIYAWGSTALTYSSLEISDAGTLGTGEVKEIATCLKKIDLECLPQDLYPEAFIFGERYKCLNEEIELNTYFEPINGTEDDYFFQWSKGGVVLNESDETSPLDMRRADKFNTSAIRVKDEDTYKVKISYLGKNIPGAGISSEGEVDVRNYDVPITQLFPDKIGSSADDSLSYTFVVNDSYYKPGTLTTWYIYEDEEDGMPYKAIEVEAGKVVTFNHPNDKNGTATDSSLTLWVEDATKVKGVLIASDSTPSKTVIFDDERPHHVNLTTYSDIELGSYDFTLTPNLATGKVKITTKVYELVDDATIPYLGTLKFVSSPLTMDLKSGVKETYTVSLDGVKLKGDPIKGKQYCIAISVSDPVDGVVTTKVTADKKGDVSVGDAGQISGSLLLDEGESVISNLVYYKTSDYKCGRIPLIAEYTNTPEPPMATPQVSADDANRLVDVYTVSGVLVRSKVRKADALNNLRKGIYIVDGKEYFVKK